jgi:molybdenum cofactor cytidylyltransferase
MNFTAIILAAGQSQRMGEDKAALPWLKGRPLLEWMVETLLEAGWKSIVVLGPHNYESWTGRLPASTLVLNPRPEAGKTTSIAAGVQALPKLVHSILLTAVDQPRPASLYRLLRATAVQRPELIIVPEDGGQCDHPVVLKDSLRGPLTLLDEQTMGLRGLLEKQEGSTYRLSCKSNWLHWDCNTTLEYNQALHWFESSSAP